MERAAAFKKVLRYKELILKKDLAKESHFSPRELGKFFWIPDCAEMTGAHPRNFIPAQSGIKKKVDATKKVTTS